MAKKGTFAAGGGGRNPRGKMSAALAVLSIGLLLVLCGVCAACGGKAGAWVGAAGMSAFILSFYGMISGFLSFHDRALSYGAGKAGAILNGIMVGVWFVILCVGLAN